MQEGLRLEVMRSAAVSGAGSYQALCLASKNEERRLAELTKRLQYRKAATPSAPPYSSTTALDPNRIKQCPSSSFKPKGKLTCFNCGEVGHFPKSESRGKFQNKYSGRSTKRVSSKETPSQPPEDTSDPLEYLLSGSEDEDEDRVNTIQLEDFRQCPQVRTAGSPSHWSD